LRGRGKKTSAVHLAWVELIGKQKDKKRMGPEKSSPGRARGTQWRIQKV